MEGKYLRSDYFQMGLNSKWCLKVIDNDKDDTSQVVMGDHSGSVESVRIQSGKFYDSLFKTMPSISGRVNAMDVNPRTQKVFMAVGSLSIKGLNKKGKIFFTLDINNLTEVIQHFKMFWPNEIFLSGPNIYNHFEINHDPSSSSEPLVLKGSFICPATINAMVILEDEIRGRKITILASQDRLIRVVNKSMCEYQFETSGIPTALCQMPENPQTPNDVAFCYGSSDGKCTMMVFETPGDEPPKFKWEFPESGSLSPVETVTMSPSGAEIIIGRSDGTIQAYTFGGSLGLDGVETLDYDSAPVLYFTFNCNESITSICLTGDSTTMVVSTFTGSVFGLSWKGISTPYNVGQSSPDQRISLLRDEIHLLEVKLLNFRASYQERTEEMNRKKKDSALSALPIFAIKDSLVLSDDASYLLSLEVGLPIDVVIMQSDVPINPMDSDKNSAVVSFSDTNSDEVLATFRCQHNTTRLEITVRSIEGQYGVMRVYIITRLPPKSCQVKHYQIRPLSLHKRSYSDNIEGTDVKVAEMTRLIIKGDFTLNEGHNWVHQCFPEVPERLVNSQDTMGYNFKSTLYHTIVSVTLTKGSLTFLSDNVSTISILKDFLTREATRKGRRIEISVDLSKESVSRPLGLLYPLVLLLSRRKILSTLKEGMKELSRTDGDIALALGKDIEETYGVDDVDEGKTITIERVYGLITDLFIDQHKLKGTASKSILSSIRSKQPDLISAMDMVFRNGESKESFVYKLMHLFGLEDDRNDD